MPTFIVKSVNGSVYTQSPSGERLLVEAGDSITDNQPLISIDGAIIVVDSVGLSQSLSISGVTYLQQLFDDALGDTEKNRADNISESNDATTAYEQGQASTPSS